MDFEVDKIEIFTLQDNYIDLTVNDSSKIVQRVTGVKKVHAIMGGFHLTGVDQKTVLEPTIRSLKELAPDFIIPAHCTGRKEMMQVEQELPDAFILNMVGTKLTFTAPD